MQRHQRFDVPDAEELAGGGAKGDVRALEVVHGRLGQHGVVLELRLAEGRAVGGNEDKFSCKRQTRERKRQEGG